MKRISAEVDCQAVLKKTIQAILESKSPKVVDSKFITAFEQLKCDGFLFFFFSDENGHRGTTVTGGGTIPDRAQAMLGVFYPKQYAMAKQALKF